MIAGLGVAACSAKRGSPQERSAPPVPASRYGEADSAAVLEVVVHEILFFDTVRGSIERKDSTARSGRRREPRVFVRIGGMPTGAWAAPIVARLRNQHWFYDGRAVDSARALAGLEDRPDATWRRPFPAELGMWVEFVGDTAHVGENWTMWFCKTQPRSMNVLHQKIHLLVQTPSGWRMTGVRPGPLSDLAGCR